MASIPILAQDREEQVVLPFPFDAQVLPGVAFLPETGSDQQRTAGGVVRQASRLDPMEAKLLEGTVGQGAATELVAFLRLFRQLPSIDEILLNPDGAPLPTEPSAQIAIATALGRVLTDHSIGKGMTYLNRMPAELRVLAIRDAAVRDRAITHTPEFTRFGIENAGSLQ